MAEFRFAPFELILETHTRLYPAMFTSNCQLDKGICYPNGESGHGLIEAG